MKNRRLIAFMNSYSQGVSGGDVCFIELAKRMGKYDTIVITSLLGKKLCESNGLKADYIITTNEQQFKNVIYTYFKRIIKVFFSNINVIRNDILYSTSDFLPDVLPAFYQKMKNKNAIWVQKIYHLVPSDRLISHYAQKISFLLINHAADLIIVDNNLLKEELINNGFDMDKVKVNYPGIDTAYFKNIKPIKNKIYDASFIGRFHTSKGIFDLVDIWYHVCEKKPDAKLAIIGGGNNRLKKELHEKINCAHLEHNIEVMGYLENDEAYGLMKASKVFVFPSHEEGFGISILEAMCCGKPVVAWNLPMYSEIFHKGLIQVKENNSTKFAEEVCELLFNEQRYNYLKNDALELSTNYNWDNTAKVEMSLLKDLGYEECHTIVYV